MPASIPDRPLRIAILDSSPLYRALLTELAEQQGWRARSFSRYTELVEAVESGAADIAVINYSDVPLAEYELRELLETMLGPTVVLAESEADRKAALRGGATLAVLKPFDPEVLALSIEAMLHRGLALRSVLSEVAQIDGLRVHLASHAVERGGRRQVLSHTEWQLFSVLLAHPGRIFTRDELARLAWGSGYAGRRAQIELYVSRVRKKVEHDPRKPRIVETVRQHGYRLTLRPQPLLVAPVEQQDAGDDLAGGAPASLEAVETWVSVYRELVALKAQMLDRARALLSSAPPDAYRSVLRSDVLLMEPEMSRLQRRLAFWEGMRRDASRWDGDAAGEGGA